MVNAIEVKATYSKASQVPRVGQRKAMRVNGRVQQVTLNNLTVERTHEWADDGVSHTWSFDTKESWGGFYDVSGM